MPASTHTPMTRDTLAARPPEIDGRRLTYSTLAGALGLASAGTAWTGASSLFGVWPSIGEILCAIAVLWWLLVVVARFPITVRRVRHLRADLRHPIANPFPAYVPIVALLLTTHYAAGLPHAAVQVLVVAGVGLLTVLFAQMLAYWLSGALHLEQVHPGYALPAIAGPFIAAIALVVAGFEAAATAAIGVGVLSWLTIGTVIYVRLVAAPALPAQLVPTLAVLVTPPLTAGLAWFVYRGGRVDLIQIVLAGVIVLLLATQLFMIRAYVRAPFSPSFWAFTFPASALASYTLRWAAVAGSTLATGLAIGALALASLTIAAVVVASLRSAWRRGGGSGLLYARFRTSARSPSTRESVQ